MDTIRAKILFTELRDHLREYGGKNLKYQTRITEDAVNDLADEFPEEEKEKAVRNIFAISGPAEEADFLTSYCGMRTLKKGSPLMSLWLGSAGSLISLSKKRIIRGKELGKYGDRQMKKRYQGDGFEVTEEDGIYRMSWEQGPFGVIKEYEISKENFPNCF